MPVLQHHAVNIFGNGRIVPVVLNLDIRSKWSASRAGRLTFAEIAVGLHQIGQSVGPITV